MHVIKVRNVCEALPRGIEYLAEYGEFQSSRAGDVLVAPGPVTTVYERPGERVLLAAARDANPFFHLYEAIWMLDGRSNVGPLLRYVKDFGKFAEDGGEMHGAYGHRWRHALGFDQLQHVCWMLSSMPNTRQAVLQMWDASCWLGTARQPGSDDLRGEWKDRPCNTNVYFRRRDGLLDMTVCCRSNDIVLGAYGANAVHFSVLQEYVASQIGARVGAYYQVSNNYHMYVQEFVKLRERLEKLETTLKREPYSVGAVSTTPMFDVPQRADLDIKGFCAWHDDQTQPLPEFANRWFSDTAVPAAQAHRCHRAREPALAAEHAETIESSDWRLACTEWLQRRKK